MSDLRECLGIEAPVLQAPIGSASGPALVAAVSNAGALGMLAGTWRGVDELRHAIRQIRASTARSFAVNLGVHATPAEKVDLCIKEDVPVISLFWGDGRQYFERIKSEGVKMIATIGTASEAREAAEAGADVIIAQGFEAGGHVWGRIITSELLPQVVETVEKVPVVAAGGIGDGRTMARAFALGANGVCLGTRFLVAAESLAHPEYQRLVINAAEADTVYGNIFDVGWPNAPHRVLRNSTVNDFLRSGRKTGEGEIVAHKPDGTDIPRYSSRLPVRGMTGNIESMALYAGQSVGCCRKVQLAAEIIRELMEDASRFGAR
jgi:nitronate monooxygenase